MSLSPEQRQNLKTSLNFFHVAELRELARKLDLVDLGKKIQISQRISHFLETGKKFNYPLYQPLPKHKKGKCIPSCLKL